LSVLARLRLRIYAAAARAELWRQKPQPWLDILSSLPFSSGK
jgi:hypothetical protein